MKLSVPLWYVENVAGGPEQDNDLGGYEVGETARCAIHLILPFFCCPARKRNPDRSGILAIHLRG